MPSSRESFCLGRPPDIVIWFPKPRCACPLDCVRALATPGSNVAKSDAERPLRGKSLTLLELTTPLTVDEVPCSLPGVKVRLAAWFWSAFIVREVRIDANPGAETETS